MGRRARGRAGGALAWGRTQGTGHSLAARWCRAALDRAACWVGMAELPLLSSSVLELCADRARTPCTCARMVHKGTV